MLNFGISFYIIAKISVSHSLRQTALEENDWPFQTKGKLVRKSKNTDLCE